MIKVFCLVLLWVIALAHIYVGIFFLDLSYGRDFFYVFVSVAWVFVAAILTKIEFYS